MPGWSIDSASAQKVIAEFSRRKTPLVVDYEHQTLSKEENGQPAPAAAWFKSLEWREGQGLFATVELTAKAAESIRNREYRFFSPVFRYNPKTGEIVSLEMGALTNTPAIDGMAELTLRAAACFGAQTTNPENTMKLAELIGMLGLAADTPEADVVAALNARLNANPLADVAKALGLDEGTQASSIVAACSALKSKPVANGQAVPIAVVNELKTEIAALNSRLAEQDKADIEKKIEAALNDGRLMKPMEQWARDLAQSDVAALNSYLDAAEPIAALSGTQTRGKPPASNGESALTPDELAVCSAMGLTEKEFIEAKS